MPKNLIGCLPGASKPRRERPEPYFLLINESPERKIGEVDGLAMQALMWCMMSIMAGGWCDPFPRMARTDGWLLCNMKQS